MAPRRQKRKSRLSRMDAALDAMTPYGFSGQRVRKAVRHLLKEYGGNEGWPFIEDCAYKELIDTLLRDNEGSGDVEDKISSKPQEEGSDVAGNSGAISETEEKNIPEPELTLATSSQVCPEGAVSTQGSGNEGARSSARPPIPPPKGVKTRSIRACYGWIKD